MKVIIMETILASSAFICILLVVKGVLQPHGGHLHELVQDGNLNIPNG